MDKLNLLTFFAIYSLVLTLTSCKSLLAPPGMVGIAGENKTAPSSSSLSRTTLPPNGLKLAFYSDEARVSIEKDEVTVSIEKIGIKTDGKSWKEIFRGNEKLTVTTSGISICGFPVAVESDEYHSIRVWFGPVIKAKRIFSDGSVVESEKSDLNKANPIEITTLNGRLQYPFTTEGGKQVHFILRFFLSNMIGPIGEPNYNWEYYRDTYLKNDITGRTTRIAG